MSNNRIELNTKADLSREINACSIQRFSDIPVHLIDHETACSWLKPFDLARYPNINEYYDQVPSRWRNEKFMRIAAKAGCRVFKGLIPSETPIYNELIEICAWNCSSSLNDIDRGRESIEFLLTIYPFRIETLLADVPWMLGVMNDGALKESFGAYLDLSTYDDVMTLSQHCRLDILGRRFATGDWFKLILPYEKHCERPESLEDCIEQLMSLNRHDEDSHVQEAVLMGFAMSHPMDEVVVKMQGSKLQKLLFEMYSTEALAPYLKKSRALRGILLEDSLGL